MLHRKGKDQMPRSRTPLEIAARRYYDTQKDVWTPDTMRRYITIKEAAIGELEAWGFRQQRHRDTKLEEFKRRLAELETKS